MAKKRLYISLPITGKDLDEQRQYAAKVAAYMSDYYEIVNPFSNGVPVDAHPSEHMRADFKLLLECDAVIMCKGWEDSSGCVAEHCVARCCHMNIIYESGYSSYYR